MDNEFGYFLITIGLIWILIVTPIDASFMKGTLILPIGLIIIGALSIILGFAGIKHVSSLIFLAFIILWIKGNWTSIPFSPINLGINLSETSSNELISGKNTEIIINIPIAGNYANSSGSNNFNFLIKHSKGLNVIEETNENSINISINTNDQTNIGLETHISLPEKSKNINYQIGAGSLTLNPETIINTETLIIDLGVGPIIIGLGKINASIINVHSGVGSININIDSLYQEVFLNASTGVGSIELNLGEGIEYMITSDTGIGSNNNMLGTKSAGFDNSTKRIMINAETGLGSVNIK